MEKFINNINRIISYISNNFLKLLFLLIIISMLFVNSIYLYIDKPDFRLNNIYNYLGIIINIIIFFLIIKLEEYISTRFSNNKDVFGIIFLAYFIFEFIYILLIPTIPFSDMGKVTSIAMSDFRENIDYLKSSPNNLPITIIFNLIFKLTTYNIFNLKIVNILCNILTIYFAYKVYKKIYKQDNRLVTFFGCISISTILYANCTYNDIIFTTLVTIILYLVIQRKDKNDINKKYIFEVSVLCFLQFIIRPVGIILIISLCIYYIFKKRKIKNAIILLFTIILLYMVYSFIENLIIPKDENVKEYTVWSYIQMGINEEEFGFQNNTHSSEWTFADVKNRINDLGFKRLITLLSKKILWLWTEGSYQVERYAFGEGREGSYYYNTCITNLVQDVEKSSIRNILEYCMKGQYFVLILLSLAELTIKEKKENINNEKELLFYLIIGIFCFYLIWEIKSRYIYCLYPIFLILSSHGTLKLKDLYSNGKEFKNNGKI